MAMAMERMLRRSYRLIKTSSFSRFRVVVS
jgi:hypothetical protein